MRWKQRARRARRVAVPTLTARPAARSDTLVPFAREGRGPVAGPLVGSATVAIKRRTGGHRTGYERSELYIPPLCENRTFPSAMTQCRTMARKSLLLACNFSRRAFTAAYGFPFPPPALCSVPPRPRSSPEQLVMRPLRLPRHAAASRGRRATRQRRGTHQRASKKRRPVALRRRAPLFPARQAAANAGRARPSNYGSRRVTLSPHTGREGVFC